jgi:NTE family protein
MSNPSDDMNKQLQEHKVPMEFIEFQNQDFEKGDALRTAALKNPKPINLVFEGGGAKGALFAGALKTLEDLRFLSEVRNVAGSSAGGMTAFMVALGYTPEETIQLVMETNFKILEDSSPLNTALNTAAKVAGGAVIAGAALATGGLSFPASIAASAIASSLVSSTSPVGFGDAYSLYSGSYIWEGDGCLNLAKQFLEKKGFSPEMTFAQLHTIAEERRSQGDNSLKDLFLTGTNIADKKTQIFSHLDTPDIKIADAFRATMSFPFAFKPHQIDMSSLGRGIVEFADGGMRMNYPMSIFNRNDDYALKGGFFGPYKPQLAKVVVDNNKAEKINPYTLGFKVDSKDECETLLFEKAAQKIAVSAGSLIKSLLINSDENVGYFYPDKTIQGDDMGISTLNFGLSPLEKVSLILSGRDASFKYVEKMQQLIQGLKRPHAPLETPKLAQQTLHLSNQVKELSDVKKGKITAQNIYNRWLEILTSEQDPTWISTIGDALLTQLHSVLDTTSASATLGSTDQLYAELQNKISEDLGRIRQEYLMSTNRKVAAALTLGFNFLERALNHTELKREHPLVIDFRTALTNKNFKTATELLSSTPIGTDKVPLSIFFALKEVVASKDTYTLSFPNELLEIENKLLQEIPPIIPQDELSKNDFQNLFLYYIQNKNKEAVQHFLQHPFMNLGLIQQGIDAQIGYTRLRFDFELEKMLLAKKAILEQAILSQQPVQSVMLSEQAQNLENNSPAMTVHITEEKNSPKRPST